MADTMLSYRDDSLANHFLTEDELMVKCPFAFRTTPTNPKVSNKYVHATTIDVVRDMAKLGWFPVDAKQCRGKKNSSGIRSFHMISFQNPDKFIKNKATGEIEAYPRIILTNSHDGFSSFKFMVGLFRLVCSNGLVISDKTFADVSIKHIHYTFEELKCTVKKAVETVPLQIEAMNKMFRTSLTDDQKREIAVKAIRIRKNIPDDQKLSISKETIDEILMPTRKEDEGNDLWTVFNLIQEKIIKGGFSFAKDEHSKARKMRKITSAIKDIEINANLYEMANSYIAA